MSSRSKSISPHHTLAFLASSSCDKAALKPRHRSFKWLKTYAGPGFWGKSLDDLSHEDLQVVLDQYQGENPGHRTGFRIIAEFNAILTWAVNSGYRKAPFTPFKRPPRRSRTTVTLSQPQVDGLLLTLDQCLQTDFAARIAVRALVCLGLGVLETTVFQLDRVDFHSWEYLQQDAMGRYRLIPIPPSMRPLLRHAKGLPALLNPGPETEPWIGRITLGKLVKDLGTRCGIQGLTPDQLRWTAIYGE